MRTSLLDLPVPRLALPAWGDEVHDTWASRAERASALTRGAGVGRNFGALVEEAIALLRAGDTRRLVERSRNRRFLRALLTAWSGDVALARATMTPSLLASLVPHGGCSRLTTITAASLFLDHFDLLDDWQPDLFRAFAYFLRHAVAAQRVRDTADLVEVLRRHEAVLLAKDGPHRLAQHLATTGGEPTTWFRSNHLSAHSDGRFGRLTRDAYFLAWIAAADPEQGEHGYLEVISNEVVARQLSETTGQDGRYFGHHVLEALTAKETRHPSAAWLEAVLDIGGDPRMEGTAQWATWWFKVSEGGRRRAVRWMQGVNLKAFLKGIEAYARDTENHGMQRMLERRRRLLIGLYEQDRVDDVRLILGDDIRAWVRRNVPASAQADICRLRDAGKQDTAVVYVDCGDFSLIEGSHNFKLHVYAGGPVPQVADPRVRVFSGRDLRETYPWRFQEKRGWGSHLAVQHDVGGSWLMKALDFLADRDVRIDERALMTPVDYAALHRRRAAEQW